VGQRGEAIHLSIESSILGNLHSFTFVFGKGQTKLPNKKKKKKKVGLGNRNIIISTPRIRGLKLQQKKNPGSWIWELEVEWGTSFF